MVTKDLVFYKEIAFMKRFVCLSLGLIMMFSQILTVSATTINEVMQQNSGENTIDAQQNAEAQGQLVAAKDTIEELSAKQAEVQSQISDAYADLVDLMILIAAAETDIADTEAGIAEMQVQLEQTNAQLQTAQDNLDQMYEDMKAHIRYLYEKDWDDVWFEVILGSKDLTTFLNRLEYARRIEEYDKALLEDFKVIVNYVTELKNTQETQMAELEAQKELLIQQQADLEAKKAELQAGLTQLQETNVDYINQINTIRTQATEIISLIGLQDEELERLMGETSDSGSDGSWLDPAISAEIFLTGGNVGTAIVAYAEQFIGYPYVWGGNSLTGGIDCSHFVSQVLKNCGVYHEGYVTSLGWRTKGEPVASLAEAQAGDIICYSGHVAIYDGNGGIVEAKGSRWGITHDRRADHAAILAIRRFT